MGSDSDWLPDLFASYLHSTINYNKSLTIITDSVTLRHETVQREFRARFKQDAPHKNNVFFKPCTKLTLHCNHIWTSEKGAHRYSLLLLRRHLGNWSLGAAASMRSELLVAPEKSGQFLLLTVYIVPV
jgi:hypothetical protein